MFPVRTTLFSALILEPRWYRCSWMGQWEPRWRGIWSSPLWTVFVLHICVSLKTSFMFYLAWHKCDMMSFYIFIQGLFIIPWYSPFPLLPCIQLNHFKHKISHSMTLTQCDGQWNGTCFLLYLSMVSYLLYKSLAVKSCVEIFPERSTASDGKALFRGRLQLQGCLKWAVPGRHGRCLPESHCRRYWANSELSVSFPLCF